MNQKEYLPMPLWVKTSLRIVWGDDESVESVTIYEFLYTVMLAGGGWA